MKYRVFSLTAAALLLVVLAPHSANVSRACTAQPTGKQTAWVEFFTPFTSARITIHGLVKSAAPEPPANGCACALRKIAPFTSIDDVQFVFANGSPIPPTSWAWQDASAAADSEWAIDAGTGTWTAFKGCNCDGVTAGTIFGIEFSVTVPPGTTRADIQSALENTTLILGTDATQDFDGTGEPSGPGFGHQSFRGVSMVEFVEIPTISEWGMIVMTVLVLTAGTIVFSRWRRPATA